MLAWWLLTSTIKAQEALVGSGAAAVAATVMTAVRGGGRRLARFRLRWLAPAWRWPGLAARDTLALAGVLWKEVAGRGRTRGTFVEVSMVAPSDDALAAGKEALATLGMSSTPNTIVLGFDREREVLVVHQAVPRHPRSVRELTSPR